LQQNGELLGFFVVPLGWQEVEHLLSEEKRLGAPQIEECLKQIDENYASHAEIFDRFFTLLFDSVWLAEEEVVKKFLLKNIFVSGGGKSQVLLTQLEKYASIKNG